MNWPRAPFELLFASLALACGGAQAPPSESPHDGPATVSVEDLPEGASISEAYRFALRPGADWQVAEESELSRFHSSAAGGAFHRDGNGWGVVTVESMPGMDLERAAELAVSLFPSDHRVLESQDPIRFHGYPAVRQVITALIEGTPFRWTNILFIHQTHLYRLTVWGSSLEPSSTEAFFESFALLEGPVVRPTREAVQTAMGVDWRVHEGRFESLAAEITVGSASGWRVVVDDELALLNAGAVVGLVHSEPDVYVIVLSERAPEAHYDGLESYLRSTTAANLGGEVVAARTLPLVDGEVELSVFRQGGIEYRHGVRCDAGRCRQLLVWFVEGATVAADRALAELPAIDSLSAAGRAACGRALAASRRERRLTGLGYAYRGDMYVDFRRGLTMRSPEGSYWEVSREAESGTAPGAELRMFDRVHGIHGLFISEALDEGVDGSAYHRNVQEAIGVPTVAPREIRLGGASGHESLGPHEAPFGRFAMRIFTTVIDRRGYRFAFWGWPAHVRAAEDSISALIATAELHGGPIPPYSMDGERLVDQRFGMSMRPPPGGEYTDFTDPTARGLSVVHGFVYPDGSIVQILATRSVGSQAQMREEIVRSMIGRMRAHVGADARPQESTTTLGGREATTIRWQDSAIPVESRFIAADRIIYGVIVIGRRDLAAIIEGFELLD